MRRTLDAIRYLENAVVHAEWTEGVVLRYGTFYGRGPILHGRSRLARTLLAWRRQRSRTDGATVRQVEVNGQPGALVLDGDAG